jgi:hypothetical protein
MSSPPATPIASHSSGGFTSNTTQFTDASGTVITHATFDTIDPTSDIQITEDLSGSALTFYDDSTHNALLGQIRVYAGQINCADFHGKGTIDDYTQLFVAASQIANETKQMSLDVDIAGFNEFANAADQLSALFTSFIVKMESVSIIDDTAFLTAVADAMRRIANLASVFGRFKETILATSTVSLPKSAHETRLVVESVMSELHCAMGYINHFVDSSIAAAPDADLSPEEQSIIQNATATINNWNVLCDQGVSIAMANHPDIQYIQIANADLKNTTSALVNATNKLKNKLAMFGIQ